MSQHRLKNILLRDAEQTDARRIAQLIDMASSGLESRDWAAQMTLSMEADGQDALDVGATEVITPGHYNYYTQVRGVDHGGQLVAMALNNIIKGRSLAEREGLSPVNRVYADLKQKAIGSFYIDSLACLPDFRGLGLGRILIEDAHQQARRAGCGQISLLAFEENAGAVRLYTRMGFHLIERLPAVAGQDMPYGGDVILMSRAVAAEDSCR